MCTVNTKLIYHQLTGHLGPVKTAGFGNPRKVLLPVSKIRLSAFLPKFVPVILWRQSKLELDVVPSGLTQNLGW